jgi:asparagine synthase (glutamine-hydrolysing)
MFSWGKRIWSRPPLDKAWEFLVGDGTPWSTYHISRQLFHPAEIDCLMGSRDTLTEVPGSSLYADDINEMSRLEMTHYMTDLLLRDTDAMSMASALEVRVPFIDKVVVRHALRLPGAWKISAAKPKAFLLDSMRGAVPNYVWDRPKMGFVLPFDRWMRSRLRGELEATFAEPRLAQTVGLRSEGLLRVWRGYLNGQVRWSRPWSLFVLLRWCEHHSVTM